MNLLNPNCFRFSISALAFFTAIDVCEVDALAATGRTVVVAAPSSLKAPAPPEANQQNLVIEAIEPDLAVSKTKEVSWLGVATEEANEALSSQLGLKPGEGLLVSYIVPDSPAARAGLQKNDVLTEFDGQVLVLPAQFRKLILMRKEADKVNLTYFRGGKKDSVEATIGKHTFSGLSENFRVLQRSPNDLAMGEDMREQMKALHESLKHAGVDKELLNVELRRNVEEVRQSLQDALRQSTNASRALGPAAREFQELARRGLEKDASVIVKSKRNAVKSIVKVDDAGTYVIVASPKKQLTAHDKTGKLLFDGPIETTEEQDKVPRDVWEHVKPMIEQLNDEKADQDVTEEESDKI